MTGLSEGRSGHSPTDIGWLDHSSVPRTGSPSPVMNNPSVLAPVQLRMRNSLSLITVIDGLTATVESDACEIGRRGTKDACIRSMTL